MKTFVADIIPRIQRFSKRLDDLTKLTNQHWVSLSDINQSKRVYIFRANNQLLISENGRVEKGSWEYLGNQSLLLDTKEESYLLKHGFFDENVIALKLDSNDNYAFFINETKYQSELNNIGDIIRFLENKYLKNDGNSGGLGSTKKQTNNVNYSYTIVSEKESFDIVLGAHAVYEIEHINGIRDKVYRGHSSGRYFYLDSINGKTYCNNFEEAVYNAFISRK